MGLRVGVYGFQNALAHVKPLTVTVSRFKLGVLSCSMEKMQGMDIAQLSKVHEFGPRKARVVQIV